MQHRVHDTGNFTQKKKKKKEKRKKYPKGWQLGVDWSTQPWFLW